MLALLLVQAIATPQSAQQRDCPERSRSAEDGEIVVCARTDRNERYRLHPLPERYVERRQVRLRLPGGGTVEPHVDQGRLGDPQIKATLKIPF
ncbi:hypothetical protein [Sphingomonas japonica]|uniref:Uncharacterized protein n=1 Tax=Sphingomonas japonica TaxID=511662 RepID=A0ABX0TZD8_9SPHN|nr:hypothetical protein [Sphingomonas japonica]NIJ23593.1 hypothetical protein [Sphingomonas japonica]